MITRLITNSSDPRALNNRAAAYSKLLALPEALKDAEAAIKIDPTFIKAYIRKALTEQAMKDSSKAMATLQKATEADVEKKVRPVLPPCTKLTRIAHTPVGKQHVEDHDGNGVPATRGNGRRDLSKGNA